MNSKLDKLNVSSVLYVDKNKIWSTLDGALTPPDGEVH